MATYDTARYWTTHNSYEGGDRGSLPAQLAKKVRCVELDFWDNDYEQFDDFRLGHLEPGHAVALGDGTPGQNPKTVLLEDWLKKTADWCAAHKKAAPITIVLDAKSDLTDNEGPGAIEDLNTKLEDAFGSALFTRAEYDEAAQWPGWRISAAASCACCPATQIRGCPTAIPLERSLPLPLTRTGTW